MDHDRGVAALGVALDLGAGNYNYTLKKLDKYWANDTRVTERNLLFDTIDETRKGAVTPTSFLPEDDSDFDGTLDRPNLDDPNACPGPDPVCDNVNDPGFGTPACTSTRRLRDRCVADHLLSWYERETDTLLLRPVIPLDEMTRYAVVITDRLLDGKGNCAYITAYNREIALHPDGSLRSSFANTRDIVLKADALGYGNILCPSSYQVGQDTLTFAAAMAPQTQRMNLLTAVRCGEVQPAMLARTIATLDHMLQGRLTINIISSDFPGEVEDSARRYRRSHEIGRAHV